MNTQIIFEKDANGTKLNTGIYKFAVLDRGIESSDLHDVKQEDQYVHIMTDTSGSMDELCSDKNTKLDQIKFVIRNMIRHIVEYSAHCDVILSISTFNQRVKKIVTGVRVSRENMDTLFKSIDEMYATDQTNIEIALKEMIMPVEHIGRVHNIFMSDGEANSGITDPIKLAELVDANAYNTFIGFGLEHDPYMFSTLAGTQGSKYYFILDKEKAGVAYGEILHGILNNVYNDVVMVCQGCEVYDYKTDSWVSTLFIGNICASDTKTYHIRRIEGEDDDDNSISIGLVTGADDICCKHFDGHHEYMPEMAYRLKTLQTLYKASNITKHCIELRITDLDETPKPDGYDARVKEIKAEMKALLKEMREFMEKQEDIRFMKNLCDDIVVVLRTIDTSYGHMFSCSRQHSQGDERIHNTTLNEEVIGFSNIPSRAMPSRLTRQHTNGPATINLYSANNNTSTNGLDSTVFSLEGQEFGFTVWGCPDDTVYSLTPQHSSSFTTQHIDPEIDDYVVSTEIDSPYCTDDKMFVIRNVSSKPEEK